ncbi:MAG: hypothetical protein ABI346_07600 [Candidatus Baltobacteraceae bacterium]
MRLSISSRFALGASAIVLLAGCSTGGSQVGPQRGVDVAGQSAARLATTVVNGTSIVLPVGVRVGAARRHVTGYMKGVDALTRLAYIDDFVNSFVAVYDRNGTQVGTITNGIVNPGGIFVDGSRNLWVANGGGRNIVEYPRGATSPTNTLNDPAGQPYDVTMCPNGTVYVSNLNGQNGKTGTIQVYAPGSVNPTGTLVYPGELTNYMITCDAQGNVFTSLYNGSSIVVEYPGGNQSGAIALPIPLTFPGGIKPDNAGNILVEDPSAQTITEYTEAGVPTGNAINTGPGSNWLNFAVTRNSRVVLGPDQALLKGTSRTFPAGALRQTYLSSSFALPVGAAFDPGQKGISP